VFFDVFPIKRERERARKETRALCVRCEEKMTPLSLSLLDSLSLSPSSFLSFFRRRNAMAFDVSQ